MLKQTYWRGYLNDLVVVDRGMLTECVLFPGCEKSVNSHVYDVARLYGAQYDLLIVSVLQFVSLD
jgi:hypothetical protein